MLELKPDRCNKVRVRSIEQGLGAQWIKSLPACKFWTRKFQGLKVLHLFLAWTTGLLLGALPFAFPKAFPVAVAYHILLCPFNVWSVLFVSALPFVLTIILSRIGFYAVLPLILWEGFLLAFSFGAIYIVFAEMGVIVLGLFAFSIFWPILLLLVIWRHMADDRIIF